jgi:hypothetical protein
MDIRKVGIKARSRAEVKIAERGMSAEPAMTNNFGSYPGISGDPRRTPVKPRTTLAKHRK